MEVHKHPHHVTHKKKWGEYVLEFVMLFFAVFLGFVAENIREDFVEKHREKQFMESLVKDLRLDTAYLNTTINAKNERIAAIDSTLEYFMQHRNAPSVPLITMRQMRRSGWDQFFFEHSGTVDQLKYSGGMRLISHKETVDTIEAYYQQVTRFKAQLTIYMNNFAVTFAQMEKLFDAYDQVKYYDKYRNALQTDTSMIHINVNYLNEYLNHLVYLKAAAITDIRNNNLIRIKAINLISLISREYDLK